MRNLEREIAAICRGVASEIARGSKNRVVVTKDNLYEFLGPIRFFPEIKARTWGPGLATGLAWTPVGGEILFIETSMMKGKGGLHPHRQAGRRDEGIRHRRPDLYPFPCQRTGH